MKVINKTEQTDTLLVKDVDENKHIVVGIIHKSPCILTKSYHTKQYAFVSLDSKPVMGNGYSPGWNRNTTIKEIMDLYNTGDNKVEAFTSAEWKKALQWLIDNS